MAIDIYNRVNIRDQEYVIKKFDAKTGLKLARLVMAKAQPLIPLLGELESNQSDDGNAVVTGPGLYRAVFAILGGMTDEDIDALVDKCLRFCYVDLPAGRQPIIDETGHYGIEDVEYDIPLTLMLCYEAIKWGAADFFDENSYLSTLFKR